ncbi:uncharacterized protein LOC142558431 [Dermacentor variabilis]|uniref:uncharacterized protein LOC142558431 n=1 Tax=Dermacentor variabilis TaxID=34621 RepID=UPI003F5C5E08
MPAATGMSKSMERQADSASSGGAKPAPPPPKPAPVAPKPPVTMTPMWKKPLLCSFEATLTPADLVFPDDGLCDISFFQVREDNYTFLRGEAGESDPAFGAFLAAAAKQTVTEHGVSLDCNKYVNTSEALKEPASRKTIKELWEKKIYHWASMNTYVLNPEEMRKALFHIMKDIKKIIEDEIKPNRPHYVVYTGTFRHPYRIENETKLFKTVMWMDGVVALAHTVEDDRWWSAGRMMPPTFWLNLQLNSVYKTNMGGGLFTIALDMESRYAEGFNLRHWASVQIDRDGGAWGAAITSDASERVGQHQVRAGVHTDAIADPSGRQEVVAYGEVEVLEEQPEPATSRAAVLGEAGTRAAMASWRLPFCGVPMLDPGHAGDDLEAPVVFRRDACMNRTCFQSRGLYSDGFKSSADTVTCMLESGKWPREA